MSTHPAIGKALDWVSTGSSFEEELHGLIWRRVRLLFAIGTAASLLLFVIDNVAMPYQAFVSPIEAWRTELWLLHGVSYATALLIVLLRRLSSASLLGLAGTLTGAEVTIKMIDWLAGKPALSHNRTRQTLGAVSHTVRGDNVFLKI